MSAVPPMALLLLLVRCTPISLPTSTLHLECWREGRRPTIIKPEEGLTCRHLLPQLVPYIKRLMILSTYLFHHLLPIRLAIRLLRTDLIWQEDLELTFRVLVGIVRIR